MDFHASSACSTEEIRQVTVDPSKGLVLKVSSIVAEVETDAKDEVEEVLEAKEVKEKKIQPKIIAYFIKQSPTARAFSSIGAIGANGLGPPPNGGLQILHIWSILQLCAHFGKPFHIIFQISTFY